VRSCAPSGLGGLPAPDRLGARLAWRVGGGGGGGGGPPMARRGASQSCARPSASPRGPQGRAHQPKGLRPLSARHARLLCVRACVRLCVRFNARPRRQWIGRQCKAANVVTRKPS